MNGKIEAELHERLCAFVLGEGDAAERARIEQLLAGSAELRAERGRLEHTVGLLREALEEGAELSPAAARAVLEGAQDVARPAPVMSFPWLRLAAGIGAVGLGAWLWHMSVNGAGPIGEKVAQGPIAPGRGGALDLDSRVRGDQGHYTYRKTGDPNAAAQPTPADHLGARMRVTESGVGQPSAMPLFEAPVERTAPDPSAEEPAIAYLLVESKTEASSGVSETTVGAPSVFFSRGKPGEALHAVGGEKRSDSSGGGGAYRGPGDSQPPAAPPVEAGTTTASKGRATFSTRALGLKREGEATRPAAAAPPASAGVAAGANPVGTPASSPSGPATGGLTGPSSPGPAPSREALGRDLEKLKSLGYSGDDGEADLYAEEDRRGRREWVHLTPQQREAHLDAECRRLLQGCVPLPHERPRDMFFRFWGDNPFEVTQLDRLSTFGADVDTASYALARRYLTEGNVPEKAQVRTEEFVNYFPSDVPAPQNAVFRIHTDLTPSRFSADTQRDLLRVVVRAKDVDKFERQPLALTFVVDVSGSMREQNRLETVKDALRLLVSQLLPGDSIALVSFSNDARQVLPMTPVSDRTAIELAIGPLTPGGSTNSNAGLQLGYAVALQGLNKNAVNRVVFLSDGVANVGETDAARITEGVKSIREQGIYLNTVGVGMNNHNDVLLEQLANLGDGMCNYIDTPKEAKRALVDRFTGAFQPVARDVKLQVEFDPAQVLRYRLLGYENRAIADADFRNDAVDAGELGAGHEVTALYELERTGQPGEQPLATVRVRWKSPQTFGHKLEDAASEIEQAVQIAQRNSFEGSPAAHRRAAIVAQFAELLRRSVHARGDSLDDLIAEAGKLRAQLPQDADFAEFAALLERSKELIVRKLPICDELCQALDLVRENSYLSAQLESLAREQDRTLLSDLARQNSELEARIRELLRRKLEGPKER